ncbi:uncharacterized protein [Ovis canadensis]|uniref:uncharacterized protein n=1 Tax=Ovis canadensis TaxID=37174 RepID=UPI0037519981
MDPEVEGTQAALIMHFLNQAAPDIRKKLQKLERLGEKSIQDLITVAERVYNTRETPEEKQTKAADRQTRNTAACILPAATVPDSEKKREHRLCRLATEDEKQGVAKGVLVQHLGPWKRPVAYLSKRLDPAASGWPPRLRMTAAVALTVKDADKLTLGQELHITAPQAIEGILKQPPDRWISNARLTHYQRLLLNPSRIIFLQPTALSPATLLPNPDLEAPIHDCSDILAQVHGTREDLQDRPLADAEVTWYTDGSSFVRDGLRYTGAAVTTETQIVWAEALPPGTSAQRAELIALTKALQLGKDKKLNIITDSRSAFATAHIHRAIYRERGLLTAEGKTIKNKEEIKALLAALWLPKKLAIIHCPGHQKSGTLT